MEGEESRGAGTVTQLLRAVADGDRAAFDRLLPLVYDELRGVAHRQLAREFGPRTLETTALVHDAYVKLVEGGEADWESRAHFFGIAARAMRQILIDYARRRRAVKRGGGMERVTLSDDAAGVEPELDELLALDEALERLDGLDSRLRQVVEHRFFGGLSENEIAAVLGVTTRTVQRDWVKARAWLHKELYPAGGPD